jgi:hypothetical protein
MWKEIPQRIYDFIGDFRDRIGGYNYKELEEAGTDRHRLHAYHIIDQKLENGVITPDQAELEKRNWDERHGNRK